MCSILINLPTIFSSLQRPRISNKSTKRLPPRVIIKSAFTTTMLFFLLDCSVRYVGFLQFCFVFSIFFQFSHFCRASFSRNGSNKGSERECVSCPRETYRKVDCLVFTQWNISHRKISHRNISHRNISHLIFFVTFSNVFCQNRVVYRS